MPKDNVGTPARLTTYILKLNKREMQAMIVGMLMSTKASTELIERYINGPRSK